MEKNLIQIYSIEVIQGYTSANVDRLSQVILQNASQRLGDNPSHTRFEDSYCPDSAIIDRIVEDMQVEYQKVNPGGCLSLINKWGHVHDKNMSTNTHNHRDSYVSAVLYTSVPEGSGKIVFRPRLNQYDNSAYASSYPPVKGVYYMFPGYLDHFVTRNNSDEMRVSISFNFSKNQ